MKLVFFLALLVVVSYSSDNNVNLVSLSYTKCLIEIQYAQNSTNNFTMVNCYDFKRDPPLVTTLWNQCTTSCCDPRNSYAQVQETLNNCDSDRKTYIQTTKQTTNSYLEILYYLYFVILGVTFIGFVVLLIHLTITVFYKRQQEAAPVQASNPSDQLVARNGGLFQKSWKYLSAPQTESCCICYLNNADVKIEKCLHMMHATCWREWYRANKRCTSCINYKTDQIRLYCTNCFSAYYMARSQNLTGTDKLPKFTCEKCQQMVDQKKS